MLQELRLNREEGVVVGVTLPLLLRVHQAHELAELLVGTSSRSNAELLSCYLVLSIYLYFSIVLYISLVLYLVLSLSL